MALMTKFNLRRVKDNRFKFVLLGLFGDVQGDLSWFDGTFFSVSAIQSSAAIKK